MNASPSTHAADMQARIQEWLKVAEPYRKYNLQGTQALIEPYIIEKSLEGAPLRMIIGTLECKLWDDQIALTESWLCSALGMAPKPGYTVFDCGANHGFNTLVYAHHVGPKGAVHAFDPFPLNADIIRFNAKLTGVDNIHVYQKGLSNRRDTLTASMIQQSVADDPGAEAATDAVPIELVRIDDYAHLRPDYIKIDIEGAEVDALEGAQEVLAARPNVYIEVHPTFIPKFNRAIMDIFNYVDLDKFICWIGYPTKGFVEYKREFEIEDHCDLYLMPREKPPIVRYYLAAAAAPAPQPAATPAPASETAVEPAAPVVPVPAG